MRGFAFYGDLGTFHLYALNIIYAWRNIVPGPLIICNFHRLNGCFALLHTLHGNHLHIRCIAADDENQEDVRHHFTSCAVLRLALADKQLSTKARCCRIPSVMALAPAGYPDTHFLPDQAHCFRYRHFYGHLPVGISYFRNQGTPQSAYRSRPQAGMCGTNNPGFPKSWQIIQRRFWL
ncbi:hypothetical protein LNP20_16050 [Klebsiella pneumoniae subsp. pneumoniae]|nr:hypothetical protein [Klebsiella pneumoniae subsp. pneumoniae]